ncbi:4'-phosphopantetheinyl transferase family protein [Pseudomonas ogarae]|uniref:Enterobactin synthase component D n=1 Tax=Pseudomonas ogarae (strain DSM 112162 / CECT 30235 / F113) TaxID=1114970 RepID=A0ABN5G8K9_PSEO1|nr:4'-phosphopantetheinyl transferase superfamily protein [Pseudomonas ogarae]AUO47503.1 enterobactin synthase subunit EntD [Pseudomonas ogarae]
MNNLTCTQQDPSQWGLDGFLTDIKSLDTGLSAVTAILGRFSLERFDPGLYPRAGVDFPPDVVRSVRSRQAEYLAGRWLSRQLWVKRNVTPIQLGSGAHRQPIWPSGWVGSISHTSTIAVSCLAKSCEVGLLGLDLENWLAPEVADRISATIVDRRETLYLGVLGPFEQMLTLAFSAKESLFKAVFPQVGCYFDFDAVRLVEIHWPSGRLVLKVTQDLSTSIRSGMLFEGYFQMWAGAVFTIIAHPPNAVAQHQGAFQGPSGRLSKEAS